MVGNANPARHDVLVLGAGIIGVSTALHLQQRGLRVCLVDRQPPGSPAAASYGNAGLIERASVVPYAFPRAPLALLRYALNRQPDVHYHLRALPGAAHWLWSYWRQSATAPLAAAARDMLPLIERSKVEHEALVRAAGLEGLVRHGGWIDVYRDPGAFAAASAEAARVAQAHGLRVDVLDGAGLAEREPALLPQARMAGGIHWLDPDTVAAPGKLVSGYADLFRQRGGVILQADARALREDEQGWTLEGVPASAANQAVIALGADAKALCAGLGYRLPMGVKRGYHMHFRPSSGAPAPVHPLCDSQAGFVLAPMQQGVRLTTGVEFAPEGAPADPTQLRRAEAIARRFWPLGEPVEAEPWLGRRPCTPDMRPVIGPAPRHRGLWFNFGHAHHGLTLGPVSGRLLAEIMTGETPFTDPAPYSARRFP